MAREIACSENHLKKGYELFTQTKVTIAASSGPVYGPGKPGRETWLHFNFFCCHVSLERKLFCETMCWSPLCVSYCTSLSSALTASVPLGQSCGRGFEISLRFLHLVPSSKTVRVKTPPIEAYNTDPGQRQRQLAQQFHLHTMSPSHQWIFMDQANDQLDTHLCLKLVPLPSCSLKL